MVTLETARCSTQEIQSLLVGAIAPRPIAFVSTLSTEGIANLAPFSFFNAFGSNPAMLAFSPARKGRNGDLKDTYNNLMSTRECVVHAVTYAMLEQMNLSSAEFPSDISEFEKSGFTKQASQYVKPWRVKESPIHMECKLYDMIHLGDQPGSGNLAICQILCFHVNESILNDQGKIDPKKVDHIARNGGSFYTRATPQSMFELGSPKSNTYLGFEMIPKVLRESHILTGNLLARLASIDRIPELLSDQSIQKCSSQSDVEHLLFKLLSEHKVTEAWQLIIAGQTRGWISYEL